jgi:hypothetical protein
MGTSVEGVSALVTTVRKTYLQIVNYEIRPL